MIFLMYFFFNDFLFDIVCVFQIFDKQWPTIVSTPAVVATVTADDIAFSLHLRFKNVEYKALKKI